MKQKVAKNSGYNMSCCFQRRMTLPPGTWRTCPWRGTRGSLTSNSPKMAFWSRPNWKSWIFVPGWANNLFGRRWVKQENIRHPRNYSRPCTSSFRVDHRATERNRMNQRNSKESKLENISFPRRFEGIWKGNESWRKRIRILSKFLFAFELCNLFVSSRLSYSFYRIYVACLCKTL